MMKDLLWRGMLAGLVAALLAGLFARVVAEPAVDAAIAFEARHEAPSPMGHDEPPVVSRATQRGLGLFTAFALFGVAMGGLFAILFAAGYGRVARIGPRSWALLLGLAAFVVVVLVPALAYPPNPPAVGLPETIGARTAAYFAMLAASLASAWGAVSLFQALPPRLVPLDRLLIAGGAFVLVVAVVQAVLPAFDEVPAGFPASLLWHFRLQAIATQALFWLIAADLFGRMAERRLAGARR